MKLPQANTEAECNTGNPVCDCFSAVLLVLFMAGGAQAQTPPPFCLPPSVPIVPSDRAMQIEYRDVLSEEYQVYFSLMGEYMTCLNAAHASAQAEVQQAIEDYNALIQAVPR